MDFTFCVLNTFIDSVGVCSFLSTDAMIMNDDYGK